MLILTSVSVVQLRPLLLQVAQYSWLVAEQDKSVLHPSQPFRKWLKTGGQRRKGLLTGHESRFRFHGNVKLTPASFPHEQNFVKECASLVDVHS